VIASRSKSATEVAEDVRDIARQIAGLRLEGTAQVDALSQIVAALLHVQDGRQSTQLEAGDRV
jgi:hypothetical protein